jgi:hypothetical protein
MSELSVGGTYALRLPDGRALGQVRVERVADGWVEGPFTPTPAFEDYRALFEREAQLRYDQVIPLWEELADAIEALRIDVVEEGGERVHPRLRVFIEGDEAILGTSPPGP